MSNDKDALKSQFDGSAATVADRQKAQIDRFEADVQELTTTDKIYYGYAIEGMIDNARGDLTNLSKDNPFLSEDKKRDIESKIAQARSNLYTNSVEFSMQFMQSVSITHKPAHSTVSEYLKDLRGYIEPTIKTAVNDPGLVSQDVHARAMKFQDDLDKRFETAERRLQQQAGSLGLSMKQ